MDNLTHSIIGLIAGHAAAQIHERRASVSIASATQVTDVASSRRVLYGLIGVTGGNLPDTDLLLTLRGGGGDKLAYLLDHRGYTHTVAGGAVLALLLFAGVQWLRSCRARPVPVSWPALLLLCTVAVGLHLAMDALNSYGVHPFWPWDDAWRYGDSVFIVEPLYWAAAAPLIFLVRTPFARSLLWLLQAAAVALCVLSALVPVQMALLLVVFIAALLAAGAWNEASLAGILPAVAVVLVTAVFVLGHALARERVTGLAASSADAQVIDVALTPGPSNPLCWEFLRLELSGDRYSIRRGRLSLLPSVLPVESCAAVMARAGRVAPTSSEPGTAGPDGAGLQWLEATVQSRERLRRLSGSCQAAGFLRFARVPFYFERSGSWWLGDARFDRGERPGFAAVELGGRTAGCPSRPPWEPPRRDLLGR